MSLEQAIQELTAAVKQQTTALLSLTGSPGFAPAPLTSIPAPASVKVEPATDTGAPPAETEPPLSAPPYKEIQGLVAQCLAKLGREATVKIVTQDLGCKASLIEHQDNPAKLIEAKRVLEAALQ